jgi:hypothetical protein
VSRFPFSDNARDNDLKEFDLKTSNEKGRMFGGNGTSLVELLVPKALSSAATAMVEAMNLNSITETRRGGRVVIIKRRNAVGEKLANLANTYFAKARMPIRFAAEVEKWRRREIDSFNLLNDDRFCARPDGDRGIIEDKLPGRNLWDHMKRGTLTRQMIIAAAKELRRAHRLTSRGSRDLWSHGDATTTNAIYDSKTDRVRWIDFEIVHNKALSTVSRHADDLLVFLLDMVGQLSARQWLTFALCFLNAYGDTAVIGQLRKRLVLPGGLAWVWWEVRTNFTAPAKITRRLATLRNVIPRLEIYDAAAVRARNKRRPSMTCHAIRPGTPILSSRTRAIRERAKAASPGMPRRFPTTR